MDSLKPRPDVVVIEDDDAIRELMIETLSEEDYAVVGVSCGQDAAAAVAATLPRLILLDRHLGDCDAQQVLMALRERPFLAQIPVVLMSASSTVHDEAAALATEGALAKPFQLVTLLACVAAFLKQPSAPRPA